MLNAEIILHIITKKKLPHSQPPDGVALATEKTPGSKIRTQ